MPETAASKGRPTAGVFALHPVEVVPVLVVRQAAAQEQAKQQESQHGGHNTIGLRHGAGVDEKGRAGAS
eukprot:scaffold7099_cov281-Pinguiococcus_pyrenoidosus.AAC.32